MRKALLCSLVLAVSVMIYGCGGEAKKPADKKTGDKPAAAADAKAGEKAPEPAKK